MAKSAKRAHSKHASHKKAHSHKKFNAKAHPRNKLGQFIKKSSSKKRSR